MPPVALAVQSALQIRYDETVPVLTLPGDLDFEQARDWFEQVVPDQLDVVGGRTARLDIGDRPIALRELRRVVHMLRERWDIEITGLYLSRDAVVQHTQRELRMKLFVHEPDAETEIVAEDPQGVSEDLLDPPEAPLTKVSLPHDLDPEDVDGDDSPVLAAPTHTPDPHSRTLNLRRTLRSGTVVRFDGDVHVFGDVNPGAQVIASGNITVLGALKGMAWAGAAGDEEASILALDNRPTQLRIGRKIAIAPERPHHLHLHPELASIRDGQIVIEPYTKGRPRTP